MKKTILVLFAIALMAFMNKNISQSTNKYEEPILITSAGQSADVTLAGMLLKKNKMKYTAFPLAKAQDLTGIKTLVIVPGFSSKGLGAAGISRDQETERINSVIAMAKKENIKIIMLHLGGTARRGGQSDDFNKLAAEASSDMVVVKQGDEDKFFSNIASEKSITIQLVDKMTDAAGAIKNLF